MVEAGEGGSKVKGQMVPQMPRWVYWQMLLNAEEKSPVKLSQRNDREHSLKCTADMEDVRTKLNWLSGETAVQNKQ